MSEESFWQLIQKVKSTAKTFRERPAVLSTELRLLPAPEIESFANVFYEKMIQSYTWDLWAIAYLANGGCSEDGFASFRGWLISEGQEVFLRALAEPESLVDSGCLGEPFESVLEEMLYVPEEAYEFVAKKRLPDKRSAERRKPAGIEWSERSTWSQEVGWTVDLVDLEERYSRAWKALSHRVRPL